MVAAARQVVAIIDHTKWGRAGAATFCRTDRIDTVITDSAAPAEMVGSLRKLGIRVDVVEPDSMAPGSETSRSGPNGG